MKKRLLFSATRILSLAIFFLLHQSSFAQVTVNIGASKDNTLIEDPNGSFSNGAGPSFFVGRVGTTGGGTIRRGVIAFNVAGIIPSGATITSVTLTLNMSQTTDLNSETIELHRTLQDWGEGTSFATGGSGTFSTTGDATWVHTFYNTSFWGAPGGNFSGTISASRAVGGVAAYTWGSTTQMVSDVQSWLDNPATNFGWTVTGNEENLQTAKRFDTKENPTPSVRPKLTVVYTPATSVERISSVPEKFVLHQNYPNPFNPATKIEFTLENAGFTVLKIYDMLGREVAALVNENLLPGSYKTTFDASGLPTGVYVYRLTSGRLVETKKMALVR
jgi:hypothetical protein